MSEVTGILCAIDQGDSSAAEQLVSLVYDERRQLAAAKPAQEKPGQTLAAGRAPSCPTAPRTIASKAS